MVICHMFVADKSSPYHIVFGPLTYTRYPDITNPPCFNILNESLNGGWSGNNVHVFLLASPPPTAYRSNNVWGVFPAPKLSINRETGQGQM